jgi:putative ABC transport system permease protein
MTLMWAELRRDKARFILLLVAVTLLLFLVAFLQSLVGSLRDRFVGAIEHQSGAVLVYSSQSQDDLASSVLSATQVRAAQAVRGVRASGPLAEGSFVIRSGGQPRSVILIGYRPGSPGTPTTLTAGVLPGAGRSTAGGQAAGVASNGSQSAGLRVGAVVTVLPGQLPLLVSGLAAGAELSSAPTIFVPYPVYTAAARAADPSAVAGTGAQVSALAADPVAGLAPAELASRIQLAVPGVVALTRAQAAAQSPELTATNMSLDTILVLGDLAVVVVIGFFFVIRTAQRRASLALLRAVGIPLRRLLGVLAGQVVAVVTASALVAGVAGALAGRTGGTLAYQFAPVTYAWTVVVALLLALLASSSALRRIARLEPVEAMRGGR